MTCTDIMYQPYTQYFSYQRTTIPQQPSPADTKKYGDPMTADYAECHRKDTQHLSSNCVLFTYYSGDISSVVDEHFSRALSQSNAYHTKEHGKDGPPMSQRNFPPSFWNQPANPALGTNHPPELTYSTDAYHAGTLHTTLHQGDPWHYTLSAQSASAYRPDLSYSSVTANRFGPQYGSFFLQPSVRGARLATVPGNCGTLEKSADTWGTARYSEALTHNLGHVDTNYSATYNPMGAMTDAANGNYIYEMYKFHAPRSCR